MSTDDYLTMDDSSNRSHLGAKSSHFQAKIRSLTRLDFTVALIKDTECNAFGICTTFTLGSQFGKRVTGHVLRRVSL